MSNLIDQLLGDFTPDEDAGIQRGQDILAISGAEDTGLLAEICPEGEHTNANPGGGPSSIIAAEEDWQQNGAKPFTREDSIMEDVLKQASGEEQTGGRGQLSPSDVNMRISALLHLGLPPVKVTAYLNKLADMQVFDRSLSDEYLKGMSGIQGLAYIEPNHFNQSSCIASLKHIQRNGTLKAASVKRIAACEDCTQCKKDPEGACKCATYGLPIVGSPQDLQPILVKLSGGSMKRAALVTRHNAEANEHVAALGGHVRDRSNERITTQRAAGFENLQSFDIQELQASAGGFQPHVVEAKIASGKTLTEVYVEAKKVYGSAKTERVVRQYLDSLKKTGTQVNLAAVDCTLLKQRLASSEAILGKKECAQCTLRNGMHCAFTGGTILSYPGMESRATKTASAEPVIDGVAYMESLELNLPALDVPLGKDRDLLDIELR